MTNDYEIGVQYDPELGEIQEFWGSKLESVIKVRAGLVEKVTRLAVIAELERLGYTVVPAEVKQKLLVWHEGYQRWCSTDVVDQSEIELNSAVEKMLIEKGDQS